MIRHHIELKLDPTQNPRPTAENGRLGLYLWHSRLIRVPPTRQVSKSTSRPGLPSLWLQRNVARQFNRLVTSIWWAHGDTIPANVNYTPPRRRQ